MNRRSFVRCLPALTLLAATGSSVANGPEVKGVESTFKVKGLGWSVIELSGNDRDLARIFMVADEFNRAVREGKGMPWRLDERVKMEVL